MEQKLKRCSDVVAFTVNTMDRVHGLGENECSGGKESDNVVYETQADLMVAGIAARRSLCSIAEERDDSSFAEAAASGNHHGDASDVSTVENESDGEAANKENTPPACTVVCWSGVAAMTPVKEGMGKGEVCSQHMHLPCLPFHVPAGSPQPTSSRLSHEPLR